MTEAKRAPSRLGRRTLSILVQAVIDQIEHEFPPDSAGEVILWRSVMYQAIKDAAEGDQEARQFFSAEEFKGIASRAALDPEAVRRG